MKLRYSLAMMALCLTSAVSAQKAQINLYTSYVFDDKFDSYYDPGSYYEGKIMGGLQFGAGIEFKPHPMQGIELMYLRQNTTAPVRYYKNGEQNSTFDVGLNYITIGGNRYFKQPGSKVEGYAGALLGCNVLSIKNSKENYSSSSTKFAWGLKGGANIWVSPRVGIKLQAQLLSSVQGAGGGLYFGTGGISTGLSTYSTMFQFSLGGGLVFKVGH